MNVFNEMAKEEDDLSSEVDLIASCLENY